MKAKAAVAAAVAAALGYVSLSLHRAWLVGADDPVSAFFLLSIATVALISVVLVVRELRFGFATARLARAAAPLPELPQLPGGRYEEAAALAEYEVARLLVDSSPDDWQAWFRVAHAYNAARDRKQARAAMRQAVRLFERDN